MAMQTHTFQSKFTMDIRRKPTNRTKGIHYIDGMIENIE
jgi:hypothetical protein